MPRFEEITIHRPEKYGGDLHYPTYEELEAGFASKELHPMDLKAGAADYMNRILEPVREKM
jgi:tyrosyl-tRNA synthetase